MDPEGRRQTHTEARGARLASAALGYPGGPSKQPRLLAKCLLSILAVTAASDIFLSLSDVFHAVCLTKIQFLPNLFKDVYIAKMVLLHPLSPSPPSLLHSRLGCSCFYCSECKPKVN